METKVIFRSMDVFGFSNLSVSIFGEVIDEKAKTIGFRINEEIIATLFWDIENPIGPYKDRILEVREFMLIPVNDKQFIRNNDGNILDLMITKYGDIWDVVKKKKVVINTNGEYNTISLFGRIEAIHRLVAKAFCFIPDHLLEQGHTFDTLVVDHKDGNKKNNCWWNLEWCTRGENTFRASELGLMRTNISEEAIMEIFDLLASGMSYTAVERKTGIAAGTVYQIRKQKSNRYVKLFDKWKSQKFSRVLNQK